MSEKLRRGAATSCGAHSGNVHCTHLRHRTILRSRALVSQQHSSGSSTSPTNRCSSTSPSSDSHPSLLLPSLLAAKTTPLMQPVWAATANGVTAAKVHTEKLWRPMAPRVAAAVAAADKATAPHLLRLNAVYFSAIDKVAIALAHVTTYSL